MTDQTDSRVLRLQKISIEIDALVRQLSPFLVKIGHLRAEAELIKKEIDSENASREVQST